jgi:hypothetical protein
MRTYAGKGEAELIIISKKARDISLPHRHKYPLLLTLNIS